MSLIATNNYLADLVADLSEAFSMFSNEAGKLSAPFGAVGSPCFF